VDFAEYIEYINSLTAQCILDVEFWDEVGSHLEGCWDTIERNKDQ